MLFSYDDSPVLFDGRLDSLELHGRFKTRQGEVQHLYHLPVPLHAGMPQALRHQSWALDCQVGWQGLVSRPRPKGLAEDHEERGAPLLAFIMALVGRMQDFEQALSESFLPWQRVQKRWMDSEEHQEPTMDVLVKHARSHRSRWPDIAERPRRVLNRRREMVPLGRVEELDTHCMEWLSRQPGRSIPERAGGSQRILALARYENLNTLENRVFRDLLERSVGASRDYLALNARRRRSQHGRGRTTRYSLVEQYGHECRRLSRELAEVGVRRETGAFQPNYVLLQDERYRHVWAAWQELVRRDRVYDDLWRWQRRAWAEFSRAACAIALLSRPGAELVAASPIMFREEHERGEWLIHDDPSVVVAERNAGWVVEVLRGDARDIGFGMTEMGASAWLRVANLKGGDYRYIPVWAINGLAGEEPLADLVESADVAIQMRRRTARLGGGLVLQALITPESSTETHSADHATGMSIGPFEKQLGAGLDRLGDELVRRVEAAI